MKAIKVKLYLNSEQISYINNLLGCSRFVYNNCLDFKIKYYNETNKSTSFGELGKHLTGLKQKYTWLKDVHSKVLQQSLINLEYAYKNFFKNGMGFPNFKKKSQKQSCRFPVDAISGVNGNRINLIRQLKDIHYKCSRRDEKLLNKYQDLIKSATLTKSKSGNYNLSILIDIKSVKKLPKTDKVIGIDLGIKDFVITSDNQTFENIKTKRNNQKKLVKLNRNLSKKVKGSNNKTKARIKLAKFHEKLNNKKENYLHLISNQLLNENQVIVMEDLNVKGMLKNHNLAKSIQELSLNRFKTLLTYKSEWYGRDLIEIGRFYPSSKTCSCCGYKNQDLTLKDRTFKCPECNVSIDRDYNAAINIRNEGIRLFKINCNNFKEVTYNEEIGLSSPELTSMDSSGYTLEEVEKEGKIRVVIN
ncbi:MAG: RNA-guided endonuclease InsQ/TnpB family protein [bacterium]